MSDEGESGVILDSDSVEFLRQKGAIEILVEIGEKEEQRHTDLRDTVPLSSSTLQTRLKSGKQQNIWEQKLVERNGNSIKVYDLTETGDRLYGIAQNAAQEQERYDTAFEYYQQRRALNRDIAKMEQKVIEYASPSDED